MNRNGLAVALALLAGASAAIAIASGPAAPPPTATEAGQTPVPAPASPVVSSPATTPTSVASQTADAKRVPVSDPNPGPQRVRANAVPRDEALVYVAPINARPEGQQPNAPGWVPQPGTKSGNTGPADEPVTTPTPLPNPAGSPVQYTPPAQPSR